MESTLLAKKNVYFHGIWKAGYRVSDKLIKSIASEIGSKPSKLCTLHLTTAGLTLEVPSTNDGKTRKTDQVAFSSLRDISVNMYQQTCLMIIYVDSNNTFSIMTCSHQDGRELEDIANMFRRQKNALLKSAHPETQSPASSNWTLRQNHKPSPEKNPGFVRESYLRSSLTNGEPHTVVSNDKILSADRQEVHNSANISTSGIAMNDYINDDEVFGVIRPVVVHEPEHLARVPVEGSHHGHSEAFSVEVQTAPFEEDFDVDSITSGISQMSSIKSEAQGTFDDSSLSPTSKYSEISSDQYFSLNHTQGIRSLGEINLFPQTTTEARHNRSSSIDDDKDTTNKEHAHDGDNHLSVMNGKNPATQTTYHLRSQGTQTINSSKVGRRYAKKQMSRTSSNTYKEKAETLRKRSSSTGAKSPTSAGSSSAGVPNVPHPTPSSSVRSGVRKSKGSVADSHESQTMKRTLSIGSTTVIKSIENVYAARSARRVNSARSHRPVNLIIYSPTPANHTT